VKQNIAIFASGSGSNAEAIIKHFTDHPKIEVALIVSNKKEAYVLQRAQSHGIDSIIISSDFKNAPDLLEAKLEFCKIDFIVLAGFLLKIPSWLIKKFPSKIINIHPALLPKYGGKGMYGKHVHQAVFNNMETESGITIHMVNEHYDEGKIVFQKRIDLDILDTPEDIASKVLGLEHENYPRIIEQILKEKNL